MAKNIFKKTAFILAIVCFASGIFWLYASAQEITLIGTILTRGAGQNEEQKIDLKLKNRGGKWQDSVTKTWEIEDAMPDDWPSCRWIRLKNVGNIEAKFLDISLENKNEELGSEESDTLPGSAEGMDEYVEITRLRYGNAWFLRENLKKKLSDSNGNGFIDLDDLEAQGFDNLSPPCIKSQKPSNFACRIKQLSICLRLHLTTPNDYQGDRVISDITFTLTDQPSD